jgi:hypothetical protein
MPLTQNVGLAGLSLSVERVEGLLQSFLGGFAGIDGATNTSGLSHGLRTPKKRGPDHRVPVISRAILDKLE